MEFTQEYWNGLPFPSPGYLPDPGLEPRFPALQADSSLSESPGNHLTYTYICTTNINVDYVDFFPRLNIKFHDCWGNIFVLFTPISPEPGIVPGPL